MRRVIFEEKGGPEVLKFETLDLPSPATGEVRIKIKATMPFGRVALTVLSDSFTPRPESASGGGSSLRWLAVA